MTSPATDAETKRHFRDNGFFGLKEAQVFFFSQGALPALSEQGRIIMEAPSRLAMAPDGNGGVYMALRAAGVLADMKVGALGLMGVLDGALRPAGCGGGSSHLPALALPARRRTAWKRSTATAWTTRWCAAATRSLRASAPRAASSAVSGLRCGGSTGFPDCLPHPHHHRLLLPHNTNTPPPPATAGARVVAKAYPEEKVGVFARRAGQLEVVEYSGGWVGGRRQGVVWCRRGVWVARR